MRFRPQIFMCDHNPPIHLFNYLGGNIMQIDTAVPTVSSTVQQKVYYLFFYKFSTFNMIQLGLSQTLVN